MAQARHLDELTDGGGPLRLVGTRGVALIMGVGATYAGQVARGPTFPAHILNLGRARAWYREDVEAYHLGKPVAVRTPGELNERIMTSEQVREPLGMRADPFIAGVHRLDWHLVPEPSGRVSVKLFWLRKDVERWVAKHPERLAENRVNKPLGRPAKPDQSGAKKSKSPARTRRDSRELTRNPLFTPFWRRGDSSS